MVLFCRRARRSTTADFLHKNTIHHVRGNENTTIKFKWWHGREADDDDDDDDGDGDISGSGEEGGEE